MNKYRAKKIFMIAPDFYGIDKSICRAFELLGFEVILKNTRKRLSLIERILLKVLPHTPILKRVLKYFLDKDNFEYIAEIKKTSPDMVFVIKGETVLPESVRYIRQELEIPCVAYVWDCPFYSYSPNNPDVYRKNNFVDGMSLYDHIFVYDPYYVNEIKKLGISQVSYLALATDPGRYRKIGLSERDMSELGFDVCFVGSPFSNRIKILDSLAEFKLGVFGDGWDNFPRPYYRGKAAGEKVLKIYSASKVVLNIHDPEATYGVNTRTFDIPACGAFELVDFKPELDKLFKAGEEIVYYRDAEDLKKLVRFYLGCPEKRRHIAEKGREAVSQRHTWSHRMKEAIALLASKGLIR